MVKILEIGLHIVNCLILHYYFIDIKIRVDTNSIGIGNYIFFRIYRMFLSVKYSKTNSWTNFIKEWTYVQMLRRSLLKNSEKILSDTLVFIRLPLNCFCTYLGKILYTGVRKVVSTTKMVQKCFGNFDETAPFTSQDFFNYRFKY